MIGNEVGIDDEYKHVRGRMAFRYDEFEPDSSSTLSFELNESNETWIALLSKFVTYLEGIYGYPIRYQIATFERFNMGGTIDWEGPTFFINEDGKPEVEIPQFYGHYFKEHK